MLLEKAVKQVIASVHENPSATVLWSLQYEQRSLQSDMTPSEQYSGSDNILVLPPPSLDLAFDDGILTAVKNAWQRLMSGDETEFMVFQEREEFVSEDPD